MIAGDSGRFLCVHGSFFEEKKYLPAITKIVIAVPLSRFFVYMLPSMYTENFFVIAGKYLPAITLFFPTSHLDVDVDLFHIYLVPRRHDFTSGPAITEILCVHGLGLFP